MSELEKLALWLAGNGYDFEVSRVPFLDVDGKRRYGPYDQIAVFEGHGKNRRMVWDVICHAYSYGGGAGLLEAAGEIVRSTDGVEGWLTAEEIIRRLEEKRQEGKSENACDDEGTREKPGDGGVQPSGDPGMHP